MFPHKRAKFPWNNWYHVMCHTYGTWLPGDPKGFRTRHHREHAEGDYKNPPPRGKYDQLWKRSKELMKRDPVYLTVPQRQRAVEEFAKSFAKWRVPVAILSIDRIHFHGIIQVLTHNPRHFVGLAKKECSAYMKLDGLAPPGGLWAVRSNAFPSRTIRTSPPPATTSTTTSTSAPRSTNPLRRSTSRSTRCWWIDSTPSATSSTTPKRGARVWRFDQAGCAIQT